MENDSLPLILSVVAVGLSLITITLQFLQKSRLDKFFKGNKDLDLEKVLNEQAQKIDLTNMELEKIKNLVSTFQEASKLNFNKFSLERFNPFEETGGDQSFVLVMLNDLNNGIILSSLHSRENTRVYAKRIIEGQSERKLSNEEENLLNKMI